jgi:hypothetical protein
LGLSFELNLPLFVLFGAGFVERAFEGFFPHRVELFDGASAHDAAIAAIDVEGITLIMTDIARDIALFICFGDGVCIALKLLDMVAAKAPLGHLIRKMGGVLDRHPSLGGFLFFLAQLAGGEAALKEEGSEQKQRGRALEEGWTKHFDFPSLLACVRGTQRFHSQSLQTRFMPEIEKRAMALFGCEERAKSGDL